MCASLLVPGLSLETTSAQDGAAAIATPLERMVQTERDFAARALVVGWKEAFLEFFDPGAIGFENGEVGLARDQVRANPDPPKEMQLIWEPRYGDIAASGELGYLTGPVRTIHPARNNGRPRHSNYSSIWKRQRDGSFRVVMDVGIPTPGPESFATGFTRAPVASRFSGDFTVNTPTLDGADRVLNSALRASAVRAYRGRLSAGARLHRPNTMPATGERAILNRLASEPSMSAIDTRFAESAQTGDLGYTWGTYIMRPRAKAKPEEGFYVRAWMRERDGQWKVALDVLQPQ